LMDAANDGDKITIHGKAARVDGIVNSRQI
jgi:hypothetical protein